MLIFVSSQVRRSLDETSHMASTSLITVSERETEKEGEREIETEREGDRERETLTIT